MGCKLIPSDFLAIHSNYFVVPLNLDLVICGQLGWVLIEGRNHFIRFSLIFLNELLTRSNGKPFVSGSAMLSLTSHSQ